MSSPKVSVVVPSYNHSPFLEECLRSALGQTIDDLEVVMVDDCSNDNSVAVARGIEDGRLRILVNESNRGTYGTQNRGLDEAVGDFIAILNSDDRWRPNKLERQLSALEANPDATFCYTLGQQINEFGQEIVFDQHGAWPKTEHHDLLAPLLSSNRLLASSVVFRKGAVRFDESLRYSGDWMAWLELASRGPAACVAEGLTDWRQHSANSYVRSKAVTLEEMRVRKSILSRESHWLKIRRESKPIRSGLSACAVDLAALCILMGEGREARRAASAAVRLDPDSRAAKRRMALTLLPLGLARRRLWGSVRLEGKGPPSRPN